MASQQERRYVDAREHVPQIRLAKAWAITRIPAGRELDMISMSSSTSSFGGASNTTTVSERNRKAVERLVMGIKAEDLFRDG